MDSKAIETINGYVDHIIWRNPDNGYTILVLIVDEEELTCVGSFPDIAEGENIEAKGEYTEHPTYGNQFRVISYEQKAPEDEDAIERYLASGAIKGIGMALAARIVRRFKKDTFRIIEEEPERLAEIKGISQRKAMEIAKDKLPSLCTSLQNGSSIRVPFVKMWNAQSLCFSASQRMSFLRTSGSPPVITKKWIPSSFASVMILSSSSLDRDS